jgi:hypothetical protein
MELITNGWGWVQIGFQPTVRVGKHTSLKVHSNFATCPQDALLGLVKWPISERIRR